MSFLDVLHTYFRGEKIEALAFILPIGLALLAFGLVILKVERNGFTWGAAVPSILFGLVLIGTGIGVGRRTSGQVAELTRSFEEAPAIMVQTELPRMHKVNANFRTTFWAFGMLVVLGLILLYLVRAEWAQGLGSALILAGAIGLLIDGFAERRAVPYTAALEDLAEQHQVSLE